MSATTQRATLDDLARAEGRAELIGGRIVYLMGTGRRPSRVAGRIFRLLDDHAEATGAGEAYTDNMTFTVPELTSGRESFSPDVAYFTGPFAPNDMRFNEGPPLFAVEVRSESNYGPAADLELAAKRADYFEAGTLVVWDVDPLARIVRCYRISAPDQPVLFHRGEVADAEPAVPGWRVPVDDMFPRGLNP